MYIKDWSYAETTGNSVYNETLGNNTYVVSINDDLSGTHRICCDGGRILSNTATRHTASGIAWEMQPTSASRDSYYPLRQYIKAVPVKSGVAMTATVWAQRSNSGITGTF